VSDNITLPRDVVQFVLQHLEWWSDDEPQEKEAITALRTALAAEQPKPSGYAYRYADGVLRLNDGSQFNGGWPVEAVPYWFAPPAAAPEPTHPGYVIGSHWLETAYSRICAGEAEADVLRDYGLWRCANGIGPAINAEKEDKR
jgi:hypothetical protein